MGIDFDDLGDRMKMYESAEAGRKFMPMLPILARIDGRSFSKFTKGMRRPFDYTMSSCMVNTTKHLVEHTGALMGYTQSDEITLVWHSTSMKSQTWFDGRIAKMTSQLAAQATVDFYRRVQANMPQTYVDRMPTFDARVWQVPTRTEATNCFVWREWDATKNSITMAASEYFSHKQLQGKNSSEKIQMMADKGIRWEEYPEFFKRGTFVQKKTVREKLSREELENLPEKHHARKNPDMEFERNKIEFMWLPPLKTVVNREAVIFDGEEPITGE